MSVFDVLFIPNIVVFILACIAVSVKYEHYSRFISNTTQDSSQMERYTGYLIGLGTSFTLLAIASLINMIVPKIVFANPIATGSFIISATILILAVIQNHLMPFLGVRNPASRIFHHLNVNVLHLIG
jgi:hypothetical protein